MGPRFILISGILFLLIITELQVCASQDTLTLRTDALTVNDGLSQGLVSCIIQDKEGLMWFGTKDGLNKYDGYHFTIYRHDANDPYSLPDNYITSMVEDDHENFWVGTYSSGLFLFDKKHERFYPVKIKNGVNPISNSRIAALQYREGKLLVFNAQLTIYDVSKVRSDRPPTVDLTAEEICFDNRELLFQSRASNNYFQYTWMSDKRLWISWTDSIFVFSPDAKGHYKISAKYTPGVFGLGQYFNCWIGELMNPNRLLFTTNRGQLLVYDFVEHSIIRNISLRMEISNSLLKDFTGNYFIANDTSQYYFNATDYSLKPIKTKLRENAFAIDRTGILWTGTSGDGIIRFDYRKQLFQSANSSIVPFSPYLDDGKVKLLNLSGKKFPSFVDVFTGEQKTILPQDAWDQGALIAGFVADKQGAFWIIYYSENNVDGIHLLSFDTHTGIVQRKIISRTQEVHGFKIFLDKEDQLWVIQYDDNRFPLLSRINKSALAEEATYRIPAKSHYVENNFMTSYWQDANNVFWFATFQGLYSFNEKEKKWNYWQHVHNDTSSLITDQLLSILPDPTRPDTYLWLGTEGGGLSRFEIATGKFINYTDRDGLPNNVVYGVLSDSAGNLWMSTNSGLSCFNPGDKTFRNFNSEDGLPGNEFNRNEYFKMPNGDLYFGGVEGAVVLNPEEVLRDEAAPPVVFTGLSIFNKPVSFKTDSSIIQLPVTYARSITLPHDKGMFTISFAALEYRAASKKHYKYFLEGYDKNWIDAGNKNEATYTNLSPGTYTFHVTASGGADVRNTNDASIRIVILPAWWQTVWFQLSLVIAVAAAAYSFYHYRLQQALKLAKLRNRIASDLHDEIGSTLSSISLYSEAAKKLMSGNEKAGRVLAKINSNTSEMMEAMSDIVWAVNMRNDKFDNLFNRMRSFAVQVSEAKNIALHFAENKNLPDITLDMVQRKNLYLIFKEAVNNAAKYSGCKNVSVEFSTHHHFLEMKIRDDGKGFSLDNSQDNKKEKTGGNGLINMRNRANDIKGDLQVLSSEENGTEVILKFNFKRS